VVNGLGGVTRFTYDAAGRIATITDPAGAVTNRAYDGAGRVTEVTDPLGRVTRFTYDAAGRPLARRDQAGETLEWVYDKAGRLTDTVSGGALVSRVERDFANRSLTLTSPAGTVDLRFDPRGNLTSRTRDGHGVSWTYDTNGRRESMTAPDGTVTRYSYDSNSRLSAVDHPVLGHVIVDRDRLGRVVEVTGDGLDATWDYRNGWVARHVVNKRGFIQVTEIERDPDGRVTAQVTDGIRTEFTYDDAGQLLSAVTGEGLETRYAYDPAGRLVEEVSNGKTTRFVYDPAGQLLRRMNPDGTAVDYTYDVSGQRAKETGPAGERLFTWDPRGFLAAVTTVTHDHDRVTSQTRHIQVDAEGELARVDATEVWWDSADFYPSTVQIGQTSTVSVGEVQALLDHDMVTWSETGQPNQSGDPWDTLAAATPIAGTMTSGDGGRALSGGSAGSSSFTGSTGGISASNMSVTFDGLQWLGARVYDPVSRGFLSTDPLNAPPGVAWAANPYSYAGNNPVNLVDPWGLSPVSMDEFASYRDQFSPGLVGTIKDAAGAVADWAADNWEYIAAGAMVVAVGQDSSGKLWAGSSNGFDASQRRKLDEMGIEKVSGYPGLHAEEELLKEVPDLERVGTYRRPQCGPAEHDCGSQLRQRGVDF
jgi:RHS repeat-associated protein